MRTIDDLEIVFAEQPRSAFKTRLTRALWRKQIILLALTVLVGLFARTYRLGSASLAEDEANKVFALRCYAQGDITVNAEHPMLMKLMCYGTVHAADVWNRSGGARMGLTISEEAALRFPNALFGALTIIPLFVLANLLLGERVALITAFLWSLGLDAIWFNRIAKEDTLLVFFMCSGYCLYALAKQREEADTTVHLLYGLAGAAFGLMVASKYFPHYFGLNFLYYTLVGYDSRNNKPVTRRSWAYLGGSMLLAFVAVNPALFIPQTWRYLWRYMNEELLTHHGYMVAGQLFINDMSETPGGNPWYFYPLFLIVKLPLPVLIAFLLGLIEIFRHRSFYPRSRGYLFLRILLVFWLLPMSVIGAKFLRYSLSLMPVLYMTTAIGIVWLSRLMTRVLQHLSFDWLTAKRVAMTGVGIVFLGAPAIGSCRAVLSSYPSLFMNQLSVRNTGYFFPHDEYYDLGARESIRYVADNAPRYARLASEIPGVVEYYLERFGRSDIRSEIISQPKFDLSGGRPDYVLLQPGRVYLENVQNFRRIEETWDVVQRSQYEGVTPAAVYRAPIIQKTASAEAR